MTTMRPGRPTSSPRSATMAEVARLAGVSSMTVSRVLRSSAVVSASTRERVENAMRQLHYSPNVAARMLVNGRSTTIGVITFDTKTYGPGAALFGIERAAHARGYGVSIATLPQLDQASMTQTLSQFARRVDGVIAIVPHLSAGAALAHTQLPLPVVAVQGSGRGPIPSVTVDQRGGALAVVRHLLDRGHDTVWHVAGPEDWFETDERMHGWQRALAERGVKATTALRGDWSAASGYAAGRQLLDEHPEATAVFSANDQMALGLLHALHEAGRTIPADVMVAGFDDIPEAAFFAPALTTVRQDFDEMGRRGLDLLLDLLEEQDVDTRPQLITPELIVRASTGGHLTAPG